MQPDRHTKPRLKFPAWEGLEGSRSQNIAQSHPFILQDRWRSIERAGGNPLLNNDSRRHVMLKTARYLAFTLAALFVLSCAAQAEEGMWTLDNLPVQALQRDYGFTPSAEWQEHVRLASVRFNDGGSGSFVSPTGLVLTNHHVAVGQLQKMSTLEKDYVKDGFYASTQADEIKCPDLELNVLVSMENVTERITKAVKGLGDEEALKARKAEIAKIEKESMDKTGFRSDVVTLYHGGEYWLYRYKKYRDVRLVIAPEKQIAFYGGDLDNFTYPRYDLDFALFRVYENEKPVEPKYFFRFNPKGAAGGDLVFVSGHPGGTDRLITASIFEYERDYQYPYILDYLARGISLLETYERKGPEEKRRAGTLKFSWQNSLKAIKGEYDQGLANPGLLKLFKAREEELRNLVRRDPELRRDVEPAWKTIAAAIKKEEKKFKELTFRTFRGLKLPGFALNIVLYSREIKKPNEVRLDGFHDSQLDTLKFYLQSPAPIYRDMEELLLEFWMTNSLKALGPKDKYVETLLGGKSPKERAAELIASTKLDDPALRKALIGGGENAVLKSGDPLITLALKLEPFVREKKKWLEDNVESVITPASEKIARARFKIYGKSAYPDATFTLRLTYGTVKGYPMNGTVAPPVTTFYGLYDRYYSFGGKSDWYLPRRWLDAEKRLDLATPLNFVSTCDIIGGNSGSPVINRNLELVGLIFDGNIESLAGNFIYSMEANRAVAVHAGGIIEALRKVCGAEKIADELMR
jgi:hypothetical protein